MLRLLWIGEDSLARCRGRPVRFGHNASSGTFRPAQTANSQRSHVRGSKPSHGRLTLISSDIDV